MNIHENDPGVKCTVTAESKKQSGKNRDRKRTSHPMAGIGISTQRLSYATRQRYNIGTELEYEITQNATLRSSLLNALEEISTQVPDAELDAYIEYDVEDEDESIIVLRARVNYNSVNEYKRLKKTIRQIVRDSEIGDTMIYTRIQRE